MSKECEEFLRRFPDLETVDILLPDMNGVLRGKQLPAKQLGKLYSGELMLPRATVLLDTCGGVSGDIPYGYKDGDPDRHLLPVAGTLAPVSWNGRPAAQVLAVMTNDGDSSWFANSSSVLGSCLAKFAEIGLKPVVAIELEFHLLKPDRCDPTPVGANHPYPDFNGPQTYNLDHMSDYSEFLLDVQKNCEDQNIHVGSTLTEFGQGQFEINLDHTADVERACYEALMLRRVVRHVAIKHGHLATFMAKPISDNSGNGLHVHISLVDDEGRNALATESERALNNPQKAPSLKMRQSIAGMLKLMPESIALFAPNANSYRRFQTNSFAPVEANWGIDHRAVSVRVPRASQANTRLEHRVAGADANPFLVVASVLAGMAYGLKNQVQLTMPGLSDIGNDEMRSQEQVQEQRGEQSLLTDFPKRWLSAIEVFEQSSILREYLGDEFCSLYAAVKRAEEEDYHHQQSPLDFKYYSRTL